MSIVYDPSKLLQKIAPEKKVKKLINEKAGLKKSALSFVSDIPYLDKKRVTEVALKTVAGYKEREAKATAEAGMDRSAGRAVRREIVEDPVQLVQRVQNEVVLQVTERIGEKYAGEFYIWLPSDADEPDPEHQLNYGKTFRVGEGEMPGERYGCRCGMEILVDEKQLEL